MLTIISKKVKVTLATVPFNPFKIWPFLKEQLTSQSDKNKRIKSPKG
jgi:hypothetical protein